MFQIHPHGVPKVFPNLVLGHPEMFGSFTLDDGWLPTDELHPVDEHLDKPTASARSKYEESNCMNQASGTGFG